MIRQVLNESLNALCYECFFRPRYNINSHQESGTAFYLSFLRKGDKIKNNLFFEVNRKVSRVVMQCRADASLVDRVLFHARALRRGTIIGLLTDENIPKYALCLRQASVRIESLLKPITGEMPMPNSRLPSWCY